MALCAVMLTACDDSLIYDDAGDCSTKVQFVFRKHRQALHSVAGRETDVFYSTVGSVHLFVYDEQTGELVAERFEKTENLKTAAELGLGNGEERCFMQLDVEPGTYRLVAWCGLDETDRNNAFFLTDGSRAPEGYRLCDVKRSASGADPVSFEKYESVYHGSVSRAVVNANGDGTEIIPIELTKNNNDIAVWIQHSSATLHDGEYEVVYTDANGTMSFDDNSLADASSLEYHPHSQSLLTSSTEYNGDLVEAGALVAHISTSRLLESNVASARLEVRKNTGETVFSIPFIRYLLEMQTFTRDSQYYLDCEDTYNCSFYLTGEEDGTWMPARIIINNWVRVPDQNADI